MSEKLDRLLELEAKATPGPWETTDVWLTHPHCWRAVCCATNTEQESLENMRLVEAMRNLIRPLVKVAQLAAELIGPKNIGKTVDVSTDWSGSAISAIMHGSALNKLKEALAALEK